MPAPGLTHLFMDPKVLTNSLKVCIAFAMLVFVFTGATTAVVRDFQNVRLRHASELEQISGLLGVANLWGRAP